MKAQDFIKKWEKGGDQRRDAQPFFKTFASLLVANYLMRRTRH